MPVHSLNDKIQDIKRKYWDKVLNSGRSSHVLLNILIIIQNLKNSMKNYKIEVCKHNINLYP